MNYLTAANKKRVKIAHVTVPQTLGKKSNPAFSTKNGTLSFH